MRKWYRVPADTLCGYCRNRFIKQGEAALAIQLPNVKRERIRCQDCAGQAPPGLPPLPDRAPIRATKKMKHIAAAKPEWLPHPRD